MDADYSASAEVARRVVHGVIEHGLPPMTILSVNIPNLFSDQIKGVQVTRLGVRVYRDQLVTRIDPGGRPYYWIGGESPTGKYEDEGTDIRAIHEGYVSVTPIQLDMTAYPLVAQIQGWNLH